MLDLSFYRGKRVFVTGHTGFKGSYLTAMLLQAGAEVTGYSLEPPGDPSLFALTGLEKDIRSVHGDVRDYSHMLRVFREEKPEVVFHLAAQPIVRISYREPRLTFETNVMGTVNLLECIRETEGVRSVLNVTTDKVYLNRDLNTPFTEDMPLDGHDPYSNSKSCSELVTHSYIRSFFEGEDSPAVSTARAGNVIGGGDFAPDRLIPDCVRAAAAGREIILRNPASTRPFQHVLEPVTVYLEIAEKQYRDKETFAGFYNVGPEPEDIRSAGELADLFCEAWGEGLSWRTEQENGPHEAAFLSLDCSLLKRKFGWKPVWKIGRAVQETVSWSRDWKEGRDVRQTMFRQIDAYLSEMEAIHEL